jgi:hypothetical protein
MKLADSITRSSLRIAAPGCNSRCDILKGSIFHLPTATMATDLSSMIEPEPRVLRNLNNILSRLSTLPAIGTMPFGSFRCKVVNALRHKQNLQEEFAGVVRRRVEALWGRMAESTRQVEGLFESLFGQSINPVSGQCLWGYNRS